MTKKSGIQVKSKQRITDHGEVFTSEQEVDAMLDLVKQETERIDSTFLEPACGDGNFLVKILERKVAVVSGRYKKSQLEFERHAVVAVSSIYGVDLLPDNVKYCRERLFTVFNKQYSSLYKNKCKEECRDAVRFILSRNILCGNALTLRNSDDNKPILFSEWSRPFNDSRIKRRDFIFDALSPRDKEDLFTKPNTVVSDLGTRGFIPIHVQEYPPVTFHKLKDYA